MNNFTYTGVFKIGYQVILKPILFQFDPELVHNNFTSFGKWLGVHKSTKNLLLKGLNKHYPSLKQQLLGINFSSPLGLSAGFDYEAKLTQITPNLGFGFETIGTITNSEYEGNPLPRLGRLPKSRSLMVNKGFKNLGSDQTIKILKPFSFSLPIGVSIGRTNSASLNQAQSVEDIIECFKKFEAAKLKISYYELNISCPNLLGSVSFYTPKNLKVLLSEVDKLKVKKPIFVKMPITHTDKETLDMLKVIANHSPKGVIFGNLQKDRKHPTLHQEETAKFKVGNFSGKPTFERSNELIELTYKRYKNRFIIIGCGGVFNAEDAYIKIKKGASLVQLITGMIFEGPQLISEINLGLSNLLKKDGYSSITQAVGQDIF